MNHFPGQWAGGQILRQLLHKAACQFIILCFINHWNQLLKSLFREPEYTDRTGLINLQNSLFYSQNLGHATELNTNLIIRVSWRPNSAVRDRASDLHSVRSKHWTDNRLRRDVKLLRTWGRFCLETFVISESSSVVSGNWPLNDLSALTIFTNILSSKLSKTIKDHEKHSHHILGRVILSQTWFKQFIEKLEVSQTSVSAGVWCVWRAVWVLWEKWLVALESALVLRLIGPELSPQICRCCWVIFHSEWWWSLKPGAEESPDLPSLWVQTLYIEMGWTALHSYRTIIYKINICNNIQLSCPGNIQAFCLSCLKLKYLLYKAHVYNMWWKKYLFTIVK